MADPPYLYVLGSFVVACSAHVTRFPQAGESAQAHAFTAEAGGKGLNLAVGARRLGAAVDGLIAIGDDAFGQMAAPALARADLPLGMLRPCEGPTGAGVAFIDASGETSVAIFPGANAALSPAHVHVEADRIRGAAFVLAAFEIGDDPITAAFGLAQAAGVATILNPSPFRRPGADILRATTLLVMNAVEAALCRAALEAEGQVIAPDDPALAQALCALGPRVVAFTRGAEGATAYGADGTRSVQPAFKVDAVDSLGAGDAFTAGLAASLLDGRLFADSLRRGAACGALATRRQGVFDALPTAAELERFLSDRECDAPSYPHGVRL